MHKRQHFDNPLPTAAYIRRSKEAEESIENQLNMVKNVIDLDPELSYVDAYIDNGYSGRDFERPAWDKLIKDCKKGLIKCIVVRDLSRIGRNYVETGTYLEDTFPSMGVRVQSILENYDSEKDEAIKIAPVNIVNQYFAEATSEQVSMQLYRSMKNGEPAGNVHYGYKKIDKTLVPDREEAEVVKKIFGLALRGLRVSEIVAILEEEQIQTPSGEPGNYKWSERTVRRMLQDDVYLGKYDRHTKERDRRKVTEVPQEEWMHFENHHEALVTEEDFNTVQQNLAKHARKKRTGSNTEPDELKGLLICASCGKQASFLRANPETGVATAKYYCRNHTGAKASGDIFEKRPEIQVDELKTKLISECNAYIKRLLELEPRMTLAKETHPNLAYAYRDRLQELSRQREERSNRILQYYEDYLKHKITREEFMQKQAEVKAQNPYSDEERQKAFIDLSLYSHAVRELEAYIPKYVPAPMAQFDPDVVRSLVDEMRLNPDGSVDIVFRNIEYVEMVEKLLEGIT